ncbi:hypothetical protein GCM10023322_26400 [Rugosimonospora acidiphila]|uniref:M23ase beta-sheet core domain-containing protein n=2 Tax=Rugosimonospora acidiphila TaxID=556531 RepID=A0ABP9RQF2_9ACTN
MPAPRDLPEPEFGERLSRALLSGGPAAGCPLLAAALREPAPASRLDAVTGQVSAALGDPFTVIGQGDGAAVAFGRSRFGVFYSRDADGLADRIEIYPLTLPRSAPRLLRTGIARWLILAVPVYLAFLLAASPTVTVRATWTVAVLAYLRGQWTNHRWDLTGVRLRPWWAGTSAVALALGWLSAGRFGTASFHHLEVLVALLTVATSLPIALAARRPRAAALPVRLPLGPGHAGYVLQGGASGWLNHHHRHPQQRWAVDILPVSGALWRNALAGTGRVEVVAPVAGTVVAAVDRYPDRPAPTVAVPPYGNHVVIEHPGPDGPTRVILCHLAEGSVAVAEGRPVSAGDPLGLVGNSGRSTEPHLHLHAVAADGVPVPLMVAGKAPWRGRLLVDRDRR